MDEHQAAADRYGALDRDPGSADGMPADGGSGSYGGCRTRRRRSGALTEDEHLAAWFPTRVVGERRAGAPLVFEFPDGEAPAFEGRMLAFDRAYRTPHEGRPGAACRAVERSCDEREYGRGRGTGRRGRRFRG